MFLPKIIAAREMIDFLVRMQASKKTFTNILVSPHDIPIIPDFSRIIYNCPIQNLLRDSFNDWIVSVLQVNNKFPFFMNFTSNIYDILKTKKGVFLFWLFLFRLTQIVR